MRYRELTSDGDYRFGQLGEEFLSNSPATVAQAVQTRLLLLQGEWFLDVTVGTPYSTEILGTSTQATHDLAIQETILNTQGVLAITDYFSSINTETRALSVSVTIDTIYGATQVTQTL